MHPSSYEKMEAFVRVHLGRLRSVPLEILDFGSQVVDGQTDSYRTLFDDPAWNYRGLDVVAGLNVDVCVTSPYVWEEITSDSVDLVVSGQALEHVEFFWASMFEVVRVLRPGGLAVVIAPSAGVEHRYPVDCWRFYRDGFDALARYVGLDVVDVFTDWGHGMWQDSVLVGRKPDWDSEGRARFARRATLQRTLVDETHPWPEPPEGPAGEVHRPLRSSPLGAIGAGVLTRELDAMAERRREAEAAAAAPPPEAPVEPGRSIRATVARLAGTNGRAAYRRLRNRLGSGRS